jgi:hypothetical protein
MKITKGIPVFFKEKKCMKRKIFANKILTLQRKEDLEKKVTKNICN